ncbi:MAG TPA: GNAT family N-acetyltransferase [Reyranella sp.]|jgi:GNAT superfamily N-acetyltransferase
MTLEIRDATAADADAAAEAMRRSITELCLADHRNDPKVLDAWLANKKPEVFRAWLQHEDQSYLVAVEDGRVVCVGGVTDAGHITLNYVSPDARFRGVSRAMLAALEWRARDRGTLECTLESTATARSFYRARGYVETGPPDRKFGTESGFPMRKMLV